MSVKSTSFTGEEFQNLNTDANGFADANNAKVIYRVLSDLTPHLAADERVWVALTHSVASDFTYKRYVKGELSKTDAIKLVKNHFFARVGGIRGLHRNNALSCLWWYAHVLSKNENHSIDDLTSKILVKTDFRAQLFERPTTARVKPVFNAITDIVIEEINQNPNTRILERKIYREWFRKINFSGGVRLYASMTDDTVKALFRELIPTP
jgi:hypothetical protein